MASRAGRSPPAFQSPARRAATARTRGSGDFNKPATRSLPAEGTTFLSSAERSNAVRTPTLPADFSNAKASCAGSPCKAIIPSKPPWRPGGTFPSLTRFTIRPTTRLVPTADKANSRRLELPPKSIFPFSRAGNHQGSRSTAVMCRA